MGGEVNPQEESGGRQQGGEARGARGGTTGRGRLLWSGEPAVTVRVGAIDRLIGGVGNLGRSGLGAALGGFHRVGQVRREVRTIRPIASGEGTARPWSIVVGDSHRSGSPGRSWWIGAGGCPGLRLGFKAPSISGTWVGRFGGGRALDRAGLDPVAVCTARSGCARRVPAWGVAGRLVRRARSTSAPARAGVGQVSSDSLSEALEELQRRPRFWGWLWVGARCWASRDITWLVCAARSGVCRAAGCLCGWPRRVLDRPGPDIPSRADHGPRWGGAADRSDNRRPGPSGGGWPVSRPPFHCRRRPRRRPDRERRADPPADGRRRPRIPRMTRLADPAVVGGAATRYKSGGAALTAEGRGGGGG